MAFLCLRQCLGLNLGPILARQVLYHVGHAPALTALASFQTGSRIYTWARLDWTLLFMLPM
jgi:hypothetical protein